MTITQLENLIIWCSELYTYYDIAFNWGELNLIAEDDIEEMANILVKIEPHTKKKEYKRLLRKIFNI